MYLSNIFPSSGYCSKHFGSRLAPSVEIVYDSYTLKITFFYDTNVKSKETFLQYVTVINNKLFIDYKNI
jgi:hypothetical protein